MFLVVEKMNFYFVQLKFVDQLSLELVSEGDACCEQKYLKFMSMETDI